MDLVHSCTLAFLRLSVEQIRLFDPDTADIIREHHLDKLTRVFQLACEQRRYEPVAASRLDAERPVNQRATELFDKVKGLLPVASPGLWVLPEHEVSTGLPVHAHNAHLYKRPRGLSDSYSETYSEPPGLNHYMHKASAPNGSASVASGNVFLGSSRNTSMYGTIGDTRQAPDASLFASEVARRKLLKESFPEPRTATRGSFQAGVNTAVGRREAAKDGVSVARLNHSDKSSGNDESDNSSGVPRATSDFGSLATDPRRSRETTSSGSDRPNSEVDLKNGNTAVVTSWAKVASMAKAHSAEPATSSLGTSKHFSGQWTSKLSESQSVLNPRSRVETEARKESPDDKLRVVWITKLPANYNLIRLGIHINRGPIMSMLLGNDLDPALPGHSVCIIFRWASEAREFCDDNWQVEAQEESYEGPYNPKTDSLPATLLRDAPGAKILPLAPYELEVDLLAMDPPSHARRRLKWSRSRLFHEVPLIDFKSDVMNVCGRNNVELFHFYNPGEATAIFSSVKVAMVVKSWFDARKEPKALGGGRDSRYVGVDCSFAKGFEEARPEKLISSYARNGFVRRVTDEKGLEGLYMGPPVVGGLTRAS